VHRTAHAHAHCTRTAHAGVDIARALRGEAAWVYVLEKKCEAPITHEGEAVTHVPLNTRLCADGLLRVDESGEAVAGPPAG